MSIRNATVRASGGFEFSGAYSIEVIAKKERSTGFTDLFRNLSANSYGEHFFFPGLTRIEHQYTYNISSKVTFGGHSTVDYGNGLSYITMSAEIHPSYQGKPVRNPDVDTSSLSGAATSAVGKVLFEAIDIFNPIKKPGYIEMIDLIWLFSKSRTETGFSDYPFSPLGLTYPNAGDIKSDAESELQYLNLDNVILLFHDYDRDEHWEVALDPQAGFNLSSSNDRPQLYTVTIKLVGLRQLPRKRKITRPMVPSVRGMLNNILFDLNNIMNQLSADLKVFTDIANDWKDLKKYKELLTADIQNFNANNRKSIDSIKSKSKNSKDKILKLLAMILAKKDPNNTLPDWNGINTTIPPVSIVVNPITLGSIDLSSLATNPTVQELNQFTSTLAQVDLAMTLSENSLNTNTISNLYTIQPGDSLASIANQFLGDPTAIGSIIDLNLGSSFDTGDTIKIPGNVNIVGLNNPEIFTQIPDLSTVENLPQFLEVALLGTDITPDLQSNLNSDIGIVTGLDNLLDTVNDILNNIPGTVPLHPDFSPLEIIGQPNELVLNLSIPRRILEAIEAEPGVKSARILNLDYSGDRLKCKLSIVPITSNQPIEIDFERAANRLVK